MAHDFAPPAGTLATPRLGGLRVVAFPSASQGVALDANGRIPTEVASLLPGYVFAHTEFTANVTVSATTADTANTIVTSASFSVDGATAVLVEFFCADVLVAANAAGNACVLTLWDGATRRGFLSQQAVQLNGYLNHPVKAAARFTPSEGEHTLSVRGYRSNANCTISAGDGLSGNYAPGYIRVTRA